MDVGSRLCGAAIRHGSDDEAIPAKTARGARREAIDKSKLAKTDEEFRDLIWIVRSADDLQQLRDSGEAVLNNLSLGDFRAFVAGLRFSRNGISTGSCRPLISSLTMTETLSLFERFGMDRMLTLDTLEEACIDGERRFSFWSSNRAARPYALIVVIVTVVPPALDPVAASDGQGR